MNIGEACNRQIATVDKHMLAFAAAKTMIGFDEPMLVVTERHDERLVAIGIVTHRDLVAHFVASRGDPLQLTVGDIMRRQFPFVMETDDALGTIDWMRRTRTTAAVVHREDGAVLGVVTLDGLLGCLADGLSDDEAPEAETARAQPQLN
jgi:CBS domain containing-hemolysin-like protein